MFSPTNLLTPGNGLCKYTLADNTRLIIPPTIVNTRSAELQNIETGVQAKNPTLSQAKSVKIVFAEHRKRRQQVNQPLYSIVSQYSPRLISSIKIIGV